MASKVKYNRELLQNFLQENDINMLKEYTENNVNCNIKIKGFCIKENCTNSYEKKFHILFKTKSFLCKRCAIIDGLIKQKETNQLKYGVDNITKLEDIKNKIKKTCLEKYGLDNPAKSQIIKDKTKETNAKKYIMKQKKILTQEEKNYILIKKYGTVNFRSSDIIKEKIKKTCMEKYNVDHISKVKDIQKIKIDNSLKKYGCKYPTQYPEIADKITRNSFRCKKFIFPSGNIVYVQGYEKFALRDLIEKENINECDIITGCKNVPEIWYNDKIGKKHRHYVDIFIKSQNRCIEIKSSWTVKKEDVFFKQISAKKLGFIYEIWVYNEKGDIIQKY